MVFIFTEHFLTQDGVIENIARYGLGGQHVILLGPAVLALCVAYALPLLFEGFSISLKKSTRLFLLGVFLGYLLLYLNARIYVHGWLFMLGVILSAACVPIGLPLSVSLSRRVWKTK